MVHGGDGGVGGEGKAGEMMSSSSSRISQLLMIHMTGGAPFGFRISAVNMDGCSPFAVSMIRTNGKAYRAGLFEGDMVLAINGFSCCKGLSHYSVTKLMEYDEPELTLHILRGENINEDDINTSLQTLESQIVELTDQEVLFTAEKKQSKQPISSSASRSKQAYESAGQSHLNLSPFRLQPPPQTRAKVMERKKDKQAYPSEKECDNEIPWNQNGLTSHSANKTSSELTTNECKDTMNLSLTTDETKICASAVCNTDINHDYSFNAEQKTKEISGPFLENISAKENSSNEKETHNRNKPQDKDIEHTAYDDNRLTVQSYPGSSSSFSHDNLNNTGLPATADRPVENQSQTRDKKWCSLSTEIEPKHQQQKQQKYQQTLPEFRIRNDPIQNRYRVEQMVEFKPMHQSRYYEAESGQVKQSSLEGNVPKRRSNSISSYHMYISGSGMKHLPTVNNTVQQINHADGLNWHQEQAKFQGTVYQWANGGGDIQPASEEKAHNSYTSKAPEMKTLPAQQSLVPSKAYQSPSPHAQHTLEASELSTKEVSSRPPSISQLSPGINKRDQLSSQYDSAASGPSGQSSPSAVVHQSSNKSGNLCQSPSTANRTPPRLIRLRSNEDALQTSPHHPISVMERTKAKERFPQPSYETNQMSHSHSFQQSQRLRPASASDCAQPSVGSGKAFPRTYFNRIDKELSTTNQECKISTPTNHLQSLVDEISINEGKGGRLFARRRANSDAWIVGERNNTTITAKPEATKGETNFGGFQNSQLLTTNVTPRRRQSLLIGKSQQHNFNISETNNRQSRSAMEHNPFYSTNNLSSKPYYSAVGTNRHTQDFSNRRNLSPVWRPEQATNKVTRGSVMTQNLLQPETLGQMTSLSPSSPSSLSNPTYQHKQADYTNYNLDYTDL